MNSIAKSSLFRQFFWNLSRASTITLLALSLISPGLAEEEKKDQDKGEKDEKSFDAIVEECETAEGLFPIHQDRKTGKVYLEIRDAQLTASATKPEFIHFSHTMDGVPAVGFFWGQFTRSRIFSLRRHFERIEFIGENTSFFQS